MSSNERQRPTPLPIREEKFARAYVIEGTAKAAAIAAGYAPKYARQTGYKLLQRPRVAQRVEELRAEFADKSAASQVNIIERYRRMSMLDVTQLLTLDEDRSTDARPIYRYKRPDELTDDQRGMLSDVTITERTRKDGTIEQRFSYKTFNAKDALDSLARTHGMFRERVEHEHNHQIKALFKFVAEHPESSELTHIIAAKHRRVIDSEVANADDPDQKDQPR